MRGFLTAFRWIKTGALVNKSRNALPPHRHRAPVRRARQSTHHPRADHPIRPFRMARDAIRPAVRIAAEAGEADKGRLPVGTAAFRPGQISVNALARACNGSRAYYMCADYKRTYQKMTTPMNNSRIGQVFYLIYDLSRQMRRWQEHVSREKGLTMPQLRAVAQLAKTDGISQAELAGLIESDPMTISGVIERLEAKGFVRREPDPTDNRAKRVFVTDEARDLVTEIRAKANKYEPELFEGISDADLAATITVLEHLSANITKLLPDF